MTAPERCVICDQPVTELDTDYCPVCREWDERWRRLTFEQRMTEVESWDRQGSGEPGVPPARVPGAGANQREDGRA